MAAAVTGVTVTGMAGTENSMALDCPLFARLFYRILVRAPVRSPGEKFGGHWQLMQWSIDRFALYTVTILLED